MRLRKLPATKRATIKVSAFSNGMNGSVDENILPFVYAREMINLDSSDGALVSGLGVSAFSGTQTWKTAIASRLAELVSPLKAYQFRRIDENGVRCDYVIFYDNGDLVAVDYFNPSNANIVVFSGLAEIPRAINYKLNSKDVIIFSFESGSMIVWDGEDPAYRVQDAPAITSMVLHYERLFATSTKDEQNTVWFSDDLDPTNWSLSLEEAGFIEMVDERGASQKVVSFLDYVYVFREYGIARISGYGDQTQFLVSQLSCNTGKIYPETVTLVGDRILFLAEDGLYQFTGLDATKILPAYNSYFEGADNSGAVAVAGEGKWYLLCNIMLENSNGQKQSESVVLEYDIATKKIVIAKGTGVVSLCSLRLPAGSKVIAIVKKSSVETFSGTSLGTGYAVGELDRSGAVFGNGLVGTWKSAWSDIGYSDSVKVIQKIALTTNGAKLKFVAQTDRMTLELDIGDDNKKSQSKTTLLRGDKIRFSIKANASTFYASDLKLVVSVSEQ